MEFINSAIKLTDDQRLYLKNQYRKPQFGINKILDKAEVQGIAAPEKIKLHSIKYYISSTHQKMIKEKYTSVQEGLAKLIEDDMNRNRKLNKGNGETHTYAHLNEEQQHHLKKYYGGYNSGIETLLENTETRGVPRPVKTSKVHFTISQKHTDLIKSEFPTTAQGVRYLVQQDIEKKKEMYERILA